MQSNLHKIGAKKIIERHVGTSFSGFVLRHVKLRWGVWGASSGPVISDALNISGVYFGNSKSTHPEDMQGNVLE